MMRQRGYTVLPSTSTTVQDEYDPHHQEQQQQQQKYRTRSHQQNYPASFVHQQQQGEEVQQDDADAAAGSRLQQQQLLHQENEQFQRNLPVKAASAHHSPSPSTTGRLYHNSSSTNNSSSHRRHQHNHNIIDDINSNISNSNNTNSNNRSVTILPSVESYATLDTTGSYMTIETAPSSACTINSVKGNTGDLEFFEDMITEPVMVLGIDISHLPKATQFTVCAVGLFFFSLLYGYLQELLSVTLCSRQLGLFLATTQFTGYTVLAYIMRNFVYRRQQTYKQNILDQHTLQYGIDNNYNGGYEKGSKMFDSKHVPLALYLGLSILRAIDLAMTNLAMQYINYPAKTLMKSSRVVFTMMFGVLIQRKVYKRADYLIVVAMVAGLATFMHADASSSAVFHHMGVIMLVISLFCDGAITNVSETIMNQYGVGQDEFIFRLYSIALMAIAAGAAVKGDFSSGIVWMLQPGTYQQFIDNVPMEERTWSVPGKLLIMVLFSSMGFFGSSCSAAITKNFGALTMSITSTARKATTLFLSFFLFHNVCTLEHIVGITMFITALTAKSLRRRHHTNEKLKKKKKYRKISKRHNSSPDASEMPLIITMASAADSPERLTFRHHRTGSNDGTTTDPISRSSVVSVV